MIDIEIKINCKENKKEEIKVIKELEDKYMKGDIDLNLFIGIIYEKINNEEIDIKLIIECEDIKRIYK